MNSSRIFQTAIAASVTFVSVFQPPNAHGAPGNPTPPPPVKPAVQSVPNSSAPAQTQKPINLMGAYGTPNTLKFGPLRIVGTTLTYVFPGRQADKCGLRRGDVVVKVNRQATPDPAKFDAVMKEFRGSTKIVEYFRHNGRRYEIKTTQINEGKAWNPPANGRIQVKKVPQHELERYMLLLVDGDRNKNGIPGALRISEGLGHMARTYADDMAKRDFMGHKDPEGRGPWDRAKLCGIKTMNIRENCAYPFPQPDSFAMVRNGESDLMASPEHRESILYPSNVCVGIGIAYRKDGGLMVVQVFSSDPVP
ncbi:hypothetical protein KF728_15970 [Candidatus Obscuribacterales bacterium]|nr:hypothetical protein [Candidatus Obscuribacterales bacterium]